MLTCKKKSIFSNDSVEDNILKFDKEGTFFIYFFITWEKIFVQVEHEIDHKKVP